MRRILVTDLAAAAWEGRFVTEPDSDYPIGELVPQGDYDEAELDWQRVASRRGHADVGELTLEQYDGSQYVQRGLQWSAACWALVEVDADGKITYVEQDEPTR